MKVFLGVDVEIYLKALLGVDVKIYLKALLGSNLLAFCYVFKRFTRVYFVCLKVVQRNLLGFSKLFSGGILSFIYTVNVNVLDFV